MEFTEEGTSTVVKEETSASLKNKVEEQVQKILFGQKLNPKFLQEILIEAGSSSRDHILGGFPYNGDIFCLYLIFCS